MGAIEISVVIIAIAFVCLVFYLIRTLKSVHQSIEQLSVTMVHMQKQIDEVSHETAELIRNTNLITLDVQKKSKALDSLFESVGEAGLAVKQISHSVKEVSSTITQSLQQSVKANTEKHQGKLNEVVRLAAVGIELWKKWQALKEKPEHKKEYVSEKLEQ